VHERTGDDPVLQFQPQRADERLDGPPSSKRSRLRGEGVAGRLVYRLLPRDDGTKLVQRVEYECDDKSAVAVAEAATATHNRRQFTAQLAALRQFLEAESVDTPDGDGDYGGPVSLVVDQ
jgi:hypothetical protein